MADLKITQLNANTTPIGTDLLAIVDDPGGSPETQKITVDNLSTVFSNNSMARQAIINGNFDVWQRGTTSTNPANNAYIADRFAVVLAADGGTPPSNIIHSRQILTSGDIANAFYHYRINPDGAGSGFGADSYYGIVQRIENGVRFLCGLNKTVTVSFWARSSIANKKIGLTLEQNYGTGGTPSSAEYINGDNWTLTSTWTRYTKTFTTNTLVGKSFGTSSPDILIPWFLTQWGTGTFAGRVNSTGVGETHVGSGTIDIAQVQLYAGNITFPFQPKSYGDELNMCKRYYVKLGGDAYFYFGTCRGISATGAVGFLQLPFEMRINPTVTSGGNFGVTKADNSILSVSGIADDRVNKQMYSFTATCSSGLVAGDATQLFANNDATAYLAFDAEI